jgi:pimeloyl-ACP methyl ester carboxylesterase
MTTTTTRTVPLSGAGAAGVAVSEYGDGQPFLLLHGGGGPDTVTGFGELFAKTHDVAVIVPTHPGFGGTARPGALTSIRDLAALYVALIGQLELDDVTVIGNSIGGWIAAEMALLASPRVSGSILVDAVGIEVPGHPIADFFSLTMDQVFSLSFHNPEPFRIDPATLPPAAQAAAAGNRAALATYAGAAMSDPTLAGRLAHLELPTLVLWGDSDQIADPDYGRAYAAAIPHARFQLLKDTGHLPQIETPDQLMNTIWSSASTGLSGQRDRGPN